MCKQYQIKFFMKQLFKVAIYFVGLAYLYIIIKFAKSKAASTRWTIYVAGMGPYYTTCTIRDWFRGFTTWILPSKYPLLIIQQLPNTFSTGKVLLIRDIPRFVLPYLEIT